MDSDKNDKDDFIGQVFFDKYKLEKKIGQGSFGRVYQGVNLLSKEPMAVKMEFRSEGNDLLESEAYRMTYMKGEEGIPKVYCYGSNKHVNLIVMELLGLSLQKIFQKKNKIGLKSVCVLGIEMMKLIEHFHNKNHIHRDIKPDNFVMGRDKNERMLYIIDYGLAKKYRSSTTKQHIPYKTHKKLTGTARYASANALKGIEQSRRDDLEAIGYVLLFFLLGVLPWQNLKAKADDERYRKIYEKKSTIKSTELCKDVPDNFRVYIDYVKKLNFTQDPDYNYLKNLFYEILLKENQVFDYNFEWLSLTPKQNNRGDISSRSLTDDDDKMKTYQNNNISMALNISNENANDVSGDITNNMYNDNLSFKDLNNGELDKKKSNIIQMQNAAVGTAQNRSLTPVVTPRRDKENIRVVKEMKQQTNNVKTVNLPSARKKEEKKEKENKCIIF